jgi:CDP-diacylglycerol--serine O-phosphatidyltransferase
MDGVWYSNAMDKDTAQELRNLVLVRRRGMAVYALPNIFTSANFILGFISILFAVDGKVWKAIWAILLASVFDLLDGRVARLTNTTSKFGVEYDSLSDLISFGLAPALLLYFSALKPFGRFGVVVATLYAVCGALRLARFNVLSAVLPKSYFQGLPIPMASLTLCTALLFFREFELPLERSYTLLFLTAGLALLMISTLRFPSFKDVHLRQKRAFTALGFSLALGMALISWFEVTAFVLIAGYILLSIGLDLLRARKKWLKR